jgi:hypothetical protein
VGRVRFANSRDSTCDRLSSSTITCPVRIVIPGCVDGDCGSSSGGVIGRDVTIILRWFPVTEISDFRREFELWTCIIDTCVQYPRNYYWFCGYTSCFVDLSTLVCYIRGIITDSRGLSTLVCGTSWSCPWQSLTIVFGVQWIIDTCVLHLWDYYRFLWIINTCARNSTELSVIIVDNRVRHSTDCDHDARSCCNFKTAEHLWTLGLFYIVLSYLWIIMDYLTLDYIGLFRSFVENDPRHLSR